MSLFSRKTKDDAAEPSTAAPARTRRRKSTGSEPDLLNVACETAPLSSAESEMVAIEALPPTATDDQALDESSPIPVGAPPSDNSPPAPETPSSAKPEALAQKTAPKRRANARRSRKVRTEAERLLQRRVAKDQRARHGELVKTFMLNQRGANMKLPTRIGSQTVEGWFKRTYIRLSRMLYRIHTFPLVHIAPDVIRRVEKEVLAAIAATETKISHQLAQCDEMLEKVGASRAFYSKHYELEVIVSTKTAMALHAIYHRADELYLRMESLDFAGLLTDMQRQKQIGTIHNAIFSLADTIDRFHTGLFVRVAQAIPQTAEVDPVAAAAAGTPVDLPEESAAEAEDVLVTAETPAASPEEPKAALAA